MFLIFFFRFLVYMLQQLCIASCTCRSSFNTRTWGCDSTFLCARTGSEKTQTKIKRLKLWFLNTNPRTWMKSADCDVYALQLENRRLEEDTGSAFSAIIWNEFMVIACMCCFLKAPRCNRAECRLQNKEIKLRKYSLKLQ